MPPKRNVHATPRQVSGRNGFATASTPSAARPELFAELDSSSTALPATTPAATQAIALASVRQEHAAELQTARSEAAEQVAAQLEACRAEARAALASAKAQHSAELGALIKVTTHR